MLEPESFFESPRGEWSTARPCPARNHSTRLVEIGYRWIPASEPSSHERALCRAAWPYLRNRALAERMLDVLAAQSFLLVGDSMTRQFAESLDDYTSAYAPAGAAAVNVLNTTRVFNAHLLLNDRYFVGGERNRSDMYPWANLLRGPHAFGAVFLSRGNHVAPTQPMMRDYEAALAFVRTHAPNALIVVRTTVASHPGCERMVNRPPLKYPNNITFSYWADLEEQNAAVKAMVAGPAFRSHAILLDIERATAYRADAHRITVRVRPGRKPLQKYDCTHYCIPGPVDMWVEVWGNLMLLAARLGLLGDNDRAVDHGR